MTGRKIGAHWENGECTFCVWAPEKNQMILHIVGPRKHEIQMSKNDQGYFTVTVPAVDASSRYYLSTENGEQIPDPASGYQPEGVHGPSQVVNHNAYHWKDIQWKGIPFHDWIIYELHIGTFTKEGTFRSAEERLDDLVNLGVNVIQIMPVSQFSGSRNWGYDGVFPFAVQNSYGTPDDLKGLIDRCHQKGIAVVLDVVYNHLGPEGNYFSKFGPYFTDHYKTPWGDAINFDGDWSDGVREYFVSNALYWFEYFHFDGLRFDAIHAVFDNGAVHFWELMNAEVEKLSRRLGRRLYTIAESDLNNPKVLMGSGRFGYGFSAQWLDDFHHSIYALTDKNGRERYYDFGRLEQFAKALKEGFVHAGEYVKFRKRKFGRTSAGLSGDQFVVFIQNHDQVGNRILGERISKLMNFEMLKISAAALLLSPYIPMLFMGEEYADDAPFFYFVSHSDPELVEAVRKGRKEEFKNYRSEGESPDPQSEETFNRSKLNWALRTRQPHKVLLDWYRTLISLRKNNDTLQNFNKNDLNTIIIGQSVLMMHRQNQDGISHTLTIFNFSEHEVVCRVPLYASTWKRIIDSRDKQWQPENVGGVRIMPEHIAAEESLIILPQGVTLYEGK
jgi:maltooligosyltrehalose trehalohydrolase